MGYLEFKKYAAIAGYRNPLQQASFKPRPVGPVASVNVANQNRSTQWQKDAPLLTAQTAADKQFKQQNTKPEARAYAMFGAAPNSQQASTQPQQQNQQTAAQVQPIQQPSVQQPAATQQTASQVPSFDIKGTYKDLPQPVQLGVQDALEAIKPGANVLELGKIDKDVFNSDEFRKLETNEEKMEYLQRIATKAGIFSALYQKDENGKVKATGVISDIINDPDKLYELPDKVLANPEFFDSLVSAVENSKDTDTLKFLQWAKDQTAARKTPADSTAPGADETGASSANKGFSVNLTEEQESKLTSAAAKSLWNQIKADPITTIPKAAGLFLNQIGMGGMASFAENPFVFYLSLAGLLLGGAALLSGGARQSNPPQVVINNGPQADPRMTQVPYGV